MKVKCIDKDRWGYHLTKGKTYVVIKENDYCYFLINDTGAEYWYEKELFKPAISEMRNDKIDKLLSDES